MLIKFTDERKEKGGGIGILPLVSELFCLGKVGLFGASRVVSEVMAFPTADRGCEDLKG